MTDIDVNINELTKKTSKLTVSFARKAPPGKRQANETDLVSNVWGVLPQKNVPIYRYDIRVLEEFPGKGGGDAAMKEVTKQCRDDFPSLDRKNKCVAVYKTLLNRESTFFGKMEALVYDRASILYSLDKLALGDETKTFVITPQELPKGAVGADCVRVHFHVKACTEDFQLTMTDLKQGVVGIDQKKNYSLQQFLELLASQEAFFTEGRFVTYGSGQSYLMDPSEFGFGNQDMPPLPEAKYIGIGASKGVRLVEGPQGPGGLNAALFMDVKKAAFHVECQTVAEKVGIIMQSDPGNIRIDARNLPLVKKLLKGIYVRCTYGPGRTFVISNISPQNASQCKFKTEKGMTSVEEHFKKKGEPLHYPGLALLCEKKSTGDSYYPMEKVVVCENQRVTQTQQSSAQVQAMIKACATLPVHRLRQTKAMTTALKLDGAQNNRWFNEFGVTTTKNLNLKGRVLPAPQIEYGRGGKAMVNQEKSSWLANRNVYLSPAKCDKWIVVALISQAERFFTRDKLNQYVRAFIGQCHQRGMQLSDPLAVEFVSGAREQDVSVNMTKAKQMGATFVHFIQSDQLKYHGQMKLVEAHEQIVTQDLMTRTATQAPQKWQTLDNIVNKTNLKLGGINFGLRLESEAAQKWLMHPGRLIVGIDVAHPPVAAVRSVDIAVVPSVVGYSSNCKQFPLDFVGGYRFAKAQMEELVDNTMCDLMIESMLKFKTNRGKLPGHLLVVRDGISDGQYKYVMTGEVEQVKRACAQVGGPTYRPHITMIVATKMHNMRLYKKDIPPQGRAADQNIKPGTVVDKHIVSPTMNEFYLNSHSAFQGTAKTPRYTTLFDTAKMSNDEIQGIIYALSYNHQIVNAAISLPAPVLIAARMASRGRNNYVAQFGDSSESTEGAGHKNIAELNIDLGYMDKLLSSCRFNA